MVKTKIINMSTNYIKVSSRKIKVDNVAINMLNSTMTILCPIESYTIFKQWMEIADAHKRSIDYSKSNVVKTIVIADKKFYNCQVLECEDYNKVTILFDHFSIPTKFTVLNQRETFDKMCDLFS